MDESRSGDGKVSGNVTVARVAGRLALQLGRVMY